MMNTATVHEIACVFALQMPKLFCWFCVYGKEEFDFNAIQLIFITEKSSCISDNKLKAVSVFQANKFDWKIVTFILEPISELTDNGLLELQWTFLTTSSMERNLLG